MVDVIIHEAISFGRVQYVLVIEYVVEGEKRQKVVFESRRTLKQLQAVYWKIKKLTASCEGSPK